MLGKGDILLFSKIRIVVTKDKLRKKKFLFFLFLTKKITRWTAIGPLGVKLVPYHSAEERNIWSTFLKILCGNMQFTGMEISWAVFVNILNLTK